MVIEISCTRCGETQSRGNTSCSNCGLQFDEISSDSDVSSLINDLFRKKGLVNILREMWPSFTPRDQKILRLFYGLDGLPRLTDSQIATMFRVTPKRITQIRRKVLRKIQTPARLNRLLRPY